MLLGTGMGKQQCSTAHQQCRPSVCHVEEAEGRSLHTGQDNKPERLGRTLSMVEELRLQPPQQSRSGE